MVQNLVQGFSIPIQIVEQSIFSKTGVFTDCEDSIYIGENYIAVIDGTTSKSDRKWNTITSGKFGSEFIGKLFSSFQKDLTARKAVDIMTNEIQRIYKEKKLTQVVEQNPSERINVTFIAVNLFRREIWLVGDCQAIIDKQLLTNNTKIDHVLSETRALFLESEILLGKSIEELLVKDVGREFILPLLERQSLFQNQVGLDGYWYSTLDGFHVPDEAIIIKKITEDTKSIILASDGYPVLLDSLEASENALREILNNDPLLFREVKSTKGMITGQISFDDRAYVKVRFG